MLSISELAQKIIKYNPGADIELLQRSYDFAERTHRGQWRKNGDPYISHPLSVAEILADLQLDIISICAGLLHDVLEDTRVRSSLLSATFREHPEIPPLVEGLTKLNKLDYSSQEEYQAENIRKMMVAMVKDVRVIFIKLADRLHNMRTLHPLPPDKIEKTSTETLEIFAPLAHRLGMYQIKAEMEDLSFSYKMPEEYQNIQSTTANNLREREKYISYVSDQLMKRLKEENIAVEINTRPKHLYSIYKKMQKLQKPIEEIYDVIAMRIIVKTLPECYQVLGIVNGLWTPIPGTYDNYISLPKANMYQALHIALMGKEGQPFEVQIKTAEMHRVAEYGIAAHWRYKEGKQTGEIDDKLTWVRELLNGHKGKLDEKNFIDDFKLTVYSEMVFVFTPKGKIIQLPLGSTPVDFAYRVHTEVGNHCVGAKSQSRIVPLDYQLKSGEKVEILTRENARPSLDWLSFVRTSSAKSKIRQWFRKQKRKESIKEGRGILEKELRKAELDEYKFFEEGNLQGLARKINFRNYEGMFAAIGYGDISAQSVLNRCEEFKIKKPPEVKPSPPPKKRLEGVVVEGLSNCEVKVSRCCSPSPGDNIVGCITRGKGITVHKGDCRNVLTRLQDKKISKDRFVKVRWGEEAYPVGIKILVQDRMGLLNEITSVIKKAKTNISSVSVATEKGKGEIKLSLEVISGEKLNNILEKIKLIKNVQKVERN